MSVRFCPECASQRLVSLGFKGTGHSIVFCKDCGTKHEIKESEEGG